MAEMAAFESYVFASGNPRFQDRSLTSPAEDDSYPSTHSGRLGGLFMAQLR